MKQCWRWFGPNDPIELNMMHQVGVEGIVTALHHIPPGAVWTPDQIAGRVQTLEAANLNWSVVESLVVSEDIKTQGPEMKAHVAAYKQSLENLAASGVETVCYNFMPILDWTRTSLRTRQSHGGTAMSFSLRDFAVFDLHILRRDGAAEDYMAVLREEAEKCFAEMDDHTRSTLRDTIIAGLPGANDRWTLDDVRARLATYHGVSTDRLRQNFIDFLGEIIPFSQGLGLRLCCHPDDPPFSLLGLPRIMSSTADYEAILQAVDLPANGATLCTGSLGVSSTFDPVDFVTRLGPRIHFVHLRNTKRTGGADDRPDFYESLHLEGDTDMVATIKAILTEENRRKSTGRQDWEIPMRPDHGQELLSDLGGHSQPGYPLIGRMRGLAELRGIMTACTD